jgi:hypothetical protein
MSQYLCVRERQLADLSSCPLPLMLACVCGACQRASNQTVLPLTKLPGSLKRCEDVETVPQKARNRKTMGIPRGITLTFTLETKLHVHHKA